MAVTGARLSSRAVGDLTHRPAAHAVPARARPLRRWGRRAGTTAMVAAGLAAAWLALVVMRAPTTAAGDPIAVRLDTVVADTLIAERLLSYAQWLVSVATLLVLGGAVFRLLVVPPHVGVAGTDGVVRARSRRPGAGHAADATLRAAVLVGIVGTAVTVPIRAVGLTGGHWGAAHDVDVLWFVATSRFGEAAAVRTIGLVAVLAALADGPRAWRASVAAPTGTGRAGRPLLLDRATRRRVVLAVGTAVILTSFGLVGHPQATDPRVVHIAAQWVHVTAAAAWFGGIAFLGIELRQQHRTGTARYSTEVVARFSTLAETTLVVCVATGVVLASSQIESPSTMLESAYGRAFAAKMGAFAVVLALGGYNRQRLVPGIVERDEPAAWSHMRRALGVEATVIALGVLLMTAAMTGGGL